MDYKEKYEKALEWMKSIYPTMQGSDKEDAEHYFPELAESEDERMINGLQGFLSAFGSDYFGTGEWWKFDDWLERQKEQPTNSEIPKESKPAEWSEADEVYLGDALWCVKQAAKVAKGENDMGACWSAERWLKSLRTQSKPKWTEEDLQHKSWILECLADGERKMPEYAEDFRAAYNWLKSLRPQPHWKPTEEQMKALKEVAYNIVGTGTATDVHLVQLYEQLKKL